MNLSVIYDYEGTSGLLFPVFIVLQSLLDWNQTLFIDIEAPFERFTFDEMDNDVMALSVPDHVYVLSVDEPLKIGLHLPALQEYVKEIATGIELIDIPRLMLRISDIEDTLQCEVRSVLHW